MADCPMGGAFEDSGEYLTAILTAAAPFIAERTLRQARDELDRRYPASKETGWVSIAMAALDDLADELEGNNK